MLKLGCFSRQELRAVQRQAALAEELVARHYCIPSRDWPRYPYEVKTLTDLREPEIAEGAFAMVSKYEYRIGGRFASRHFELYGICLQDHNIRMAMQRSEGIGFAPLLLYILTHELIHVLRFSDWPQRYYFRDERRVQEEKQVHKVTRDILFRRRDAKLDRVLQLYREYPNFPSYS
ncbi:MAG: hypothetical protein AB1898_27395 [Acidobacteriota bacterium]